LWTASNGTMHRSSQSSTDLNVACSRASFKDAKLHELTPHSTTEKCLHGRPLESHPNLTTSRAFTCNRVNQPANHTCSCSCDVAVPAPEGSPTSLDACPLESTSLEVSNPHVLLWSPQYLWWLLVLLQGCSSTPGYSGRGTTLSGPCPSGPEYFCTSSRTFVTFVLLNSCLLPAPSNRTVSKSKPRLLVAGSFIPKTRF
jgi:hypothetical protein